MKNIDLAIEATKRMIENDVNLDMTCFRSKDGIDVEQTEKEIPCGTCGCFLGNMPFQGIKGLELIESDFDCSIDFNCYIDFNRYGWRVFDLSQFCKNRDEWDFLFSTYWPNDLNQCLARLEHLKENGVPDEFAYYDRY